MPKRKLADLSEAAAAAHAHHHHHAHSHAHSHSHTHSQSTPLSASSSTAPSLWDPSKVPGAGTSSRAHPGMQSPMQLQRTFSGSVVQQVQSPQSAGSGTTSMGVSPRATQPAGRHARRESEALSGRSSAGAGGNETPKVKMEPQPHLPGITRKVKACAACRKQKIRCYMDDGPPCRRCKERGLSCVLNKSLQTLMHEDTRWKSCVNRDIVNIHNALREIRQALSLPQLGSPSVLQQAPNMFLDQDDAHEAAEPLDHVSPSQPQENHDDSYDTSPELSPQKESAMPHVPIESLYQITGLKSLRSETTAEGENSARRTSLMSQDFIARGVISLEEAERLANFYLTRLDPYIYGLCVKFKNLDDFRRSSSVLTACICTVSALHETSNPHLYTICSHEFRQLVSGSFFDRRVDIDFLRALCVGSYWLSDISWILSGYAIRRSSELQLSRFYEQSSAKGSKEASGQSSFETQDALDKTRVMYLLYVCDQHLSILYSRASIIREQGHIQGWEKFCSSTLANESDERLASQVGLLLIMSKVRDLFGPDTGEPVSQDLLPQIEHYATQLDGWIKRWSVSFARVRFRHIGNFPSVGIQVHYNFAKLHLCSHIFRGVGEGEPIPMWFLPTATTAVRAAISTIEWLLGSEELQTGLAGVPHYFHTMIAFSCVFLLKVATRHNSQLFVEPERAFRLTGDIARIFRKTEIGQWHLVHRMAEGLEKMVEGMKTALHAKEAANANASVRPNVGAKMDMSFADTGTGNLLSGLESFEKGLSNSVQMPLSDLRTISGGVFPSTTTTTTSNVAGDTAAASSSSELPTETQQPTTTNTPGVGEDVFGNIGFNDQDFGLGIPFFDFEGTNPGLDNLGFGFL